MPSHAFTAKELLEEGYHLKELKGACTVAELRRAGKEPKELQRVGISVAQLRDGGFTAVVLKEAGYTVEELRKGGV